MLRRSLSINTHRPSKTSLVKMMASTSSSLAAAAANTNTSRGLFTPTSTRLSIPMSSSQGATPYENMINAKNWFVHSFHRLTGRERSEAALQKKIRGKHGLQKAACVIAIAPDDEKKVSGYGKRGEKFTGEKFKVLFVSRTTAETHTTSLDFVNNTSAEDYDESWRIAHSNDKIYDFVGGKVQINDVKTCEEDSSFQEAFNCQIGTKMPWIPERVTVIRELAEELGIVVDNQGNFRSRKYLNPSFIGANRLIPFMELVSPLQDGEDKRLDMSYFLLQTNSQVPDECELTPKLWGRENDVVDARWMTVEDALNEHNKLGSGFKLAPFTHFIVQHLGQHPSVGTLMATSRLKHRNDLMEMTVGEPFVETSDGNYNMHFQREQMPTMPCGKHVLGSLGYELPWEYRDEAGANVVASRIATVGTLGAQNNLTDTSAGDGKKPDARQVTVHDVSYVGKNAFAVPHSAVFSRSSHGSAVDIVEPKNEELEGGEGEAREKLEGSGENSEHKEKIAAGDNDTDASDCGSNKTRLEKEHETLGQEIDGDTASKNEQIFKKQQVEEEAQVVKEESSKKKEDIDKSPETSNTTQQQQEASTSTNATATASDTDNNNATSSSSFKPKFKPKTFPKLVVHIGSPLMQATNQIHQAYYDRVIEYRKVHLVESKWAREEARKSSKWDATD